MDGQSTATRLTNFDSKLNQGKIGEGLIAEWFKRKGFAVLPVYEKQIDEGKGPQIFCGITRLIAPDMLIFKPGKTYWIEAKQKTAFSWHRLTGRWVTGIDLRHYEDYLQVSSLTDWPFWILFLHMDGYAPEPPRACPTGLFGNEIQKLRTLENHRSDKWGRSGMVYWAVESLVKLAELPIG